MTNRMLFHKAAAYVDSKAAHYVLEQSCSVVHLTLNLRMFHFWNIINAMIYMHFMYKNLLSENTATIAFKLHCIALTSRSIIKA